MKYRIWENMFTEYTDSPSCVILLGEIEAQSHQEAYKEFIRLYPEKTALRVDDYAAGGNTAIEYGA